MKDLLIEDVRTLKFLNKEKLDYFIDCLEKGEKIEGRTSDQISLFTDDSIPDDNHGLGIIAYNLFKDFSLEDFDKTAQQRCKEALTVINSNKEKLDLKPSQINYFMHDMLFSDLMLEEKTVKLLFEEKGLYYLLLCLRNSLNEYLPSASYYEEKYGSENLISDEEDCENGAKAGSLAVKTNPTWEEDWKEFIKHDMQWDGKFLILLIIHKLELMKKYFSEEKYLYDFEFDGCANTEEEINKALELSKFVVGDGWIDENIIEDERAKLKAKANRDFFIYLADHFERWWH